MDQNVSAWAAIASRKSCARASRKNFAGAFTLAGASLLAMPALAGGDHGHGPAGPDDHAPIGVMGDHTHQRGEWMFSYRYMVMDMAGNGRGTDSVSRQTIATTVPNRFFGRPMQPPTLRVVPTRMTMQMHMAGVMYAPTDRVTLMGMFNYVDKEMDHITFAGGSGDTVLGRFTTRTRGLGDTRLAALIDLGGTGNRRLHATLGVSLPTGDIDQEDQVLAPNGMRPELRLPYPMQLGSGTYDLIAGLTYAERHGRLGWGSQWQSTFRIGENDQDYRLGDEHHLTAWGSWRLAESVSASLRGTWRQRGNIDGIDPRIVAPVQTADPDNQGYRRFDLGAGVNWLLPGRRHRLALEATVPVFQDLRGPQLETDWQLSVGYQLTL
jgi:hypothetical protein